MKPLLLLLLQPVFSFAQQETAIKQLGAIIQDAPNNFQSLKSKEELKAGLWIAKKDLPGTEGNSIYLRNGSYSYDAIIQNSGLLTLSKTKQLFIAWQNIIRAAAPDFIELNKEAEDLGKGLYGCKYLKKMETCVVTIFLTYGKNDNNNLYSLSVSVLSFPNP